MHLRLFWFGALALGWLGAACAQGVGTVVQAVGDARIAGQTAALGSIVQAGQPLTTGAASYLYIKTTDGGFFILRPGSTAQVIAYQIDPANPANSQFKLELSRGVARSISGSAVKNARQSFRFNTPVAAIGVRGTDFTVFTDDQTTRISVLSGGVVASGFGSGCSPQGSGPCEGNDKRELFANQLGQILQVNRGQLSPQVIIGNTLAPDLAAPPRPDEPAKPVGTSQAPAAAKPVATVSPDANPGQRKLADLDVAATVPPAPGAIVLAKTLPPAAVSPTPSVPAPQPVPVVTVNPPPPVAPVVPAVPAAPALAWGRWQPLASAPAETDLVALTAGRQLIATNSYFALAREANNPWQSPVSGSASFTLQSAQAVVRADSTGATQAAAISNGRLTVDFAKSRFATQFDLLALGRSQTMTAEGNVGKDGLFGNSSQYAPGSNMLVKGALAQQQADTRAAYLFQSRLNSQQMVSGVTLWNK